MPGAWRAGTIYNVSVPAVQAMGHEQHDNPDTGARPWIIVSNRFVRAAGVVLAVPLTRSSGQASRGDLPLALGDVDTADSPFPLEQGGTILVCQVRALAVERFDARVRGRLKKLPLKELLAQLAGLFEPVR